MNVVTSYGKRHSPLFFFITLVTLDLIRVKEIENLLFLCELTEFDGNGKISSVVYEMI